MTNESTPSQEERKSGVFDGIKGAKSQDLDAVAEPKESTQTAAPDEPGHAGETEAKEPDDVAELRKELSRAKQALAQRDRKLAEVGPYAQFGMVVASDEKGKAIVQRYEKGQALFDEDGQMNYDEQPAQQETSAITEEKLVNILDQREATKELTRELNNIAEEQLPDFNKIKRNPKYRDFFTVAQGLVWNGRLGIDDDVLGWENDFAAKEYTAMKKAYNMYLADEPKVREAVEKAKELQQKERKQALNSVPSSDGKTTSSQEEQEEGSPEDDLIKRMLNVKGRGRSFASVGSKTR